MALQKARHVQSRVWGYNDQGYCVPQGQDFKRWKVGNQRKHRGRLFNYPTAHLVYYKVLDSASPSRMSFDIKFTRFFGKISNQERERNMIALNADAYFSTADKDVLVRQAIKDKARLLLDQSFTPKVAGRTAYHLLNNILTMLNTQLSCKVTADNSALTFLMVRTTSKLSVHIITPLLVDNHRTRGALLPYKLGIVLRHHFI